MSSKVPSNNHANSQRETSDGVRGFWSFLMEVLGLCWEYGDQWSINTVVCFECCDHDDALMSIDVISNTHGVYLGLE
jgi:hypothetical protein